MHYIRWLLHPKTHPFFGCTFMIITIFYLIPLINCCRKTCNEAVTICGIFGCPMLKLYGVFLLKFQFYSFFLRLWHRVAFYSLFDLRRPEEIVTYYHSTPLLQYIPIVHQNITWMQRNALCNQIWSRCQQPMCILWKL